MNDLTMWEDGAREDDIVLETVDPKTLDATGEVAHVNLENCSITEGYETDNRVQGQVEFEGEYDYRSWFRFVHICEKYGYRNEMALLIPDVVTYNAETKMTSISCQSVLWSLSEDTQPSHFAIAKGARTKAVFNRIMQITGRKGEILAGAGDSLYGEAKAYPIGDSFLSDLFDICNAANNRLECTGHGVITMGAYVKPKKKAVDWEIDPDDSRTILLTGSKSTETNIGSAASRTVVVWKGSNDKEIAASQDVASTSVAAASRRGYTVAKVHQVQDLNPQNQAQAYKLAEQYIEDDSDLGVTRSISCLYFPVHEGDILKITGDRRWCVTQVQIKLSGMTVDLTLKEA